MENQTAKQNKGKRQSFWAGISLILVLLWMIPTLQQPLRAEAKGQSEGGIQPPPPHSPPSAKPSTPEAIPSTGDSSSTDKAKAAPPLAKPEIQNIQKLIKSLGDPSFQVREESEAQLKKVGTPAIPSLEKTLHASQDAEVLMRSRRILQSFKEEQRKKTPQQDSSDSEGMAPSFPFVLRKGVVSPFNNSSSGSSGMHISLPGSGAPWTSSRSVIIHQFFNNQPGVHSQSYAIQIQNGRVHVKTTVNGKVQEYQADSLENLKKKHPDLVKKLGLEFSSVTPGGQSLGSVNPFQQKIFERLRESQAQMNQEMERARKEMEQVQRSLGWNLIGNSPGFNFNPSSPFSDPQEPVSKEKKSPEQEVAPSLGLFVQERERETTSESNQASSAKHRDLVVTQITPGSWADQKIGLKKDDVILSLNGENVTNSWAFLRSLKRNLKQNQTFQLQVVRDGKPTELKVK